MKEPTRKARSTTPRARRPRALPIDAKVSGAVTLKHIAGVVGVSMQTVSSALNARGSVSEELREQIREAARQLGYRPNRSARTMRTGQSNTIGLIVYDMSMPFFAELAQALERALASAGYAVLLIDVQGQEVPSVETLERIEALPSFPVDGVISTIRYKAVANLDLPVVFTGGREPARDSAGIDDALGQRLLVEHLLKLGHRNFGLVTCPTPGGVPVRRHAAIETLQGRGTIAWEYRTPVSENVDDDFLQLIKRRNVTAIICMNDVVAISVQAALRRSGISVPGDVSVVGHDGIAWAGIVTPALTTVRMPFGEIAKAATQLLIERLKQPNKRARSIRFPATFVEGESSGPVPVRR